MSSGDQVASSPRQPTFSSSLHLTFRRPKAMHAPAVHENFFCCWPGKPKNIVTADLQLIYQHCFQPPYPGGMASIGAPAPAPLLVTKCSTSSSLTWWKVKLLVRGIMLEAAISRGLAIQQVDVWTFTTLGPSKPLS